MCSSIGLAIGSLVAGVPDVGGHPHDVGGCCALSDCPENVEENVTVFLIVHAGLEVASTPLCHRVEDGHAIRIDRQWRVWVGDLQRTSHRRHLPAKVRCWASNIEMRGDVLLEESDKSSTDQFCIFRVLFAPICPQMMSLSAPGGAGWGVVEVGLSLSRVRAYQRDRWEAGEIVQRQRYQWLPRRCRPQRDLVVLCESLVACVPPLRSVNQWSRGLKKTVRQRTEVRVGFLRQEGGGANDTKAR
eukprot:1625683-Rhodomonas_salina.3